MARGSSSSGSGSTEISGTRIGMAGEALGIENTGKKTLRKKYFLQTTSAADLEKPEEIAGYRPTSVSNQKLADGMYEQSVDYQAQVDAQQAPGLVETLQGVSGTFEMFTSYESHPIELHPRIDKLSVDFGGYFTPDGFAKWPPFYTPTSGGGLGSGTQVRNPMFGVTRYKEVNMTLRHTYFVNGLSQSIYEKAGKIVARLPAGYPTPSGPIGSDGRQIPRRWMMQMPATSREGNAYRVVQEYVLLDTSGVAEGLYEVTSTPGQV
jgi:hypothetical protein